MKRADVVVMGAGFGGLAAALQLARQGHRVALLEALNYPGGCACSFERQGARFDAGATLAMGLGPGELLRGWLDQAGVPLRSEPLTGAMAYRDPRAELVIDPDPARWPTAWGGLGGSPPAAITAWWGWVQRVARTLGPTLQEPELLPPWTAAALGRHLARSPQLLPLLPWVGRPLGALLDAVGLGPGPVRSWLDHACQITVQAPLAEAEALFALGAQLPLLQGAHHVEGGLGALAEALLEAARRAGVMVSLADRVGGLKREDGGWRVEARRGAWWAPTVVANLLPQDVARLTGRSSPRGERLAGQVRSGWQAAALYWVVDQRAFPNPGAGHLQLVADPDSPPIEGNGLLVSWSAEREQRAGPGQRVVTVSTHLRPHPTDPAGHSAKVQARMEQTLRALAPEIVEARQWGLTASARTFARFTRREDGWVGGVPRRAGLTAYQDLAPRPLEEGLYLVGDTVFPGQSTLAAAVGGHRAAAAVLGGAAGGWLMRPTRAAPSATDAPHPGHLQPLSRTSGP